MDLQTGFFTQTDQWKEDWFQQQISTSRKTSQISKAETKRRGKTLKQGSVITNLTGFKEVLL